MKKTGRKIIGLFLVVSMLCSVLPLAVMATPITDGHYIKLEELDYSNREAGFSQNNSVASMSGGKVRVNWATTYGELDFTVNIPSTGQYTIWVYGGESGNTYVSPSKLVLDGTTDLNWQNIQGGTQESGMSFRTAYHSVTTNLTAGSHTIKYILTGVRPAGTYYAGAFDFMMIVPSGYSWTPAKDTYPVANGKSFTEGGYAWLEELDYSNREAGFSQNNSVASMSGGKVRVHWAATYGELDFAVNIPSAGEYTIWVYGGQSNDNNVSPSKLVLDNTTDLNWQNIQGGIQESGMSFNTAYHSVTTALTAGIHTFKYILTDHRPADSNYAGAFDFMVIMPSNYTWTPSKDTYPTDPSVKSFTNGGYAWLEELDYSNREAGFSQNNSVASMSGGKVRVHWAATYGELDFKVNIPGAGEYTIWVYGGQSNNDNVSPSKLVLDNTTDLNWQNIQGAVKESGMSFNTAYHSVTTDLTAGIHTFKYILTDHRPADSTYAGAFDFMVIMPSNYEWTPSKTEIPIRPIIYREDEYLWIEGESAETGFSSKPEHAEFSGGKTYRLATQSVPGDAGHYVEYDVDLAAGTYDIYFRAVDDAFALNSSKTGSYMSDAHTYVDGVEKPYKNVLDEGWGTKFADPLSNYAHGWLKVSDVELNGDTHTIRLAYLAAATANPSWYFGGLDCIAIVPGGSQFVPVEKDINATKKDAEMSVLLSDYNLKTLKGDIILPETAIRGETITWTSSVPSAVATDGTVTRSESADRRVKLTAATDSYTKTFRVKVKKITDFEVSSFTKSGSIGLNKTLSANATLNYTKGESKDAMVVIALYDNNDKLLMCGVDTKSVTLTDADIDAAITIPSDYAKDLTNSYIKAFLWSGVTPIEKVFETRNDDFVISEVGNDTVLHSDDMEDYLEDSYDSVALYADSQKSIDRPNPIEFNWKYLRNDKANVVNYTVRVSESPDMTDAWEYSVKNEYADIYNFKSGTSYYWTVTANYADSSVTSPVSTFTTTAHAPRVLSVEGISNVRDLGGWSTADGKTVKQGLVYRSMALSYLSGETFKEYLTADGKNTMKNELGIKSEIDIRGDSEMPIETYTESVLGEDVNYFRKPLNYNEDYLDEDNRAALKEIFEIFADKNNYPIDFHCAAGADRTGMVAYFLNGLLGVSREDLFRDYLLTNFAKTDNKFRPLSGIEGKYIATVDAYSGNTLQEKIYNYLSEVIGVSQEDLDFIISYMTE